MIVTTTSCILKYPIWYLDEKWRAKCGSNDGIDKSCRIDLEIDLERMRETDFSFEGLARTSN